MKKNVASQHIGAEVVNASTGAGVTAAVTVTVSGDGGAFGASGGTLAHLANGWWDYIPTQAETNYTFIAFQFTATGAIPTTASCFTDSITIKKNTALGAFMFLMTDVVTHAPKTGLTVTATRSIDGGAFASCANSVTEIATGSYKIDLAASDVNGNTIMLRLTATGADDLNIFFVTQI